MTASEFRFRYSCTLSDYRLLSVRLHVYSLRISFNRYYGSISDLSALVLGAILGTLPLFLKYQPYYLCFSTVLSTTCHFSSYSSRMTFTMPHCTSSDIPTCLPGNKTPVYGSCSLCIVVFEPLLHERVCTATVLDQQCSRRRRPLTAPSFLLILIGRWIGILYAPDQRLDQANRLETRLTTAPSFTQPLLALLVVANVPLIVFTQRHASHIQYI